MSAKLTKAVISLARDREQSMELLDRLIAVAQPGAAYGVPIISGDYTLITASEVSLGMGFGYGLGGRAAPEPAAPEAAATEGEPQSKEQQPGGLAGGAGGGGGAGVRPVAVISIGPQGVRIEPVIDATKVTLAFLTTLGAMSVMLARIFRAGR